MPYWALMHPSCSILFPCMRGENIFPNAAWMIVEEPHWRELRADGHYTRRETRRHTYLVDREFQKLCCTDIDEPHQGDGGLVFVKVRGRGPEVDRTRKTAKP